MGPGLHRATVRVQVNTLAGFISYLLCFTEKSFSEQGRNSGRNYSTMVKHVTHGSPTAGSMVSDSAKNALLAQKFPNFNCICELCDCGCIARQRHSKTCKRQPARNRGTDTEHHKDCLLTHYQQTYQAPRNVRRTLPLIPPPTPRDPNPPPMTLATTQRTEYTQHNDVKKAEPVKFTDHYERSDEPVEGLSSYKDSYPGHTNFPARVPPIRGRPPQEQDQSLASFDPRTSHKEQFKKWNTQPAVPFTDLPSFAGSCLYPGKRLGELHSTSQQDFKGQTIAKPEHVKTSALEHNIKLDGDFDHATVHKQTYTDFGPGHKATKCRPVPKIGGGRRSGIAKETQHMKDFPMYSSQPPPAQAIEPPAPTIQLRMNSRLEFVTEQRNRFKGHDTNIHRKPDMMMQGQNEYVPPAEKFATLTSTGAAYQPIHSVKVQKVKARRPTSQTGRSPGPFDDQTTNKKFYRNWGPKPRVRYGDIQEGRIYVAPVDKVEAESWNRATYRPVKLEKLTESYKPVEKPIQAAGAHDFQTVHRETYIGQQPKLCNAQAYLMQQELLRQGRKGTMVMHHDHSVDVRI